MQLRATGIFAHDRLSLDLLLLISQKSTRSRTWEATCSRLPLLELRVRPVTVGIKITKTGGAKQVVSRDFLSSLFFCLLLSLCFRE